MALFNIYQINFTDAQVRIINDSASAARPEFYEQYLDTICEPTPEAILKAGYQYKLVAQIEANNLEHVYRIGNIGPEDKVRRLAPMHSISVGDVVDCCATKEIYYVDVFGFKKVEGFKKYL